MEYGVTPDGGRSKDDATAQLRRQKRLKHIIGGSKGDARDGCPPPWGSKFFHFYAVFGKNVKNNSNFGSWRPPWGKSWIRHCICTQ